MFLRFAILVALVLCVNAQIDVKGIDYGGTGCPSGTVTVTMTPDKSTYTVLFDSYVASTGPGKMLDRKSCNVAIPVKVEQGFQVQLFKIDYRGFAQIPVGGRGRFHAEYFFAGANGPSVDRTFGGGYTGDFLHTDNVVGTSLVWSPCGSDVILRMNTDELVQKRSANSPDEAMLAIDSADIQRKVLFHFSWRSCPHPRPPEATNELIDPLPVMEPGSGDPFAGSQSYEIDVMDLNDRKK